MPYTDDEAAHMLLKQIWFTIMYLVEFAIAGTHQLSSELLVCTQSAEQAQEFAHEYASNWGMEVFAVTHLTEQQLKASRLQCRPVLIQGDSKGE
jgi:hypothetical protein